LEPRHAEAFEWDDGNESELAAHRISTIDVDDVFLSKPIWFPNRNNRPGNWKMVGKNRGGRALTIVCTWDEVRRVLRPITGWDATDGEKGRYLR
jgi:hypothetical protein